MYNFKSISEADKYFTSIGATSCSFILGNVHYVFVNDNWLYSSKTIYLKQFILPLAVACHQRIAKHNNGRSRIF